MKTFLATIAAAVLAITAGAQQTAWGQCGGEDWTGATSCPSGWTCTYSNTWYSQCLPGSASTSAQVTTLDTSTSSASATASPASTSSAPPPTGSGTTGGGSIVTVSGTSFNIDGHTGYFAGTNSYWIGFLTNNDDVDLVMSHLAASGLKVLRVWGFNIATSTPSSSTIYYQSLVPGSPPAINTGATGLERLDYVVQSAEANGIKLVVNFANNWSDYGGVPAYMTYYNLTQEQWYTSSEAQATYQAYIEAVVSRYSTSTAIFAWELMNEPRCHGCDTSVLTSWAATTSAYIKSLDGNHLVTLGDEGFAPSAGDGSYPFGTSEGVDFAANLQVETLDYGTYHMYPSSWGTNDTTWCTLWIQQHAQVCLAAGKPCILEEYGWSSEDGQVAVEQPWQQTALASNGNSADMFWQYGDTLSSGQSPDDGFTIYYGTSDYTSLVTDHVAAIASSGR